MLAAQNNRAAKAFVPEQVAPGQARDKAAAELAKERQLAALETSGKRGGKVMAFVPQPMDAGTARDKAAAAVGVSPRPAPA